MPNSIHWIQSAPTAMNGGITDYFTPLNKTCPYLYPSIHPTRNREYIPSFSFTLDSKEMHLPVAWPPFFYVCTVHPTPRLPLFCVPSLSHTTAMYGEVFRHVASYGYVVVSASLLRMGRLFNITGSISALGHQKLQKKQKTLCTQKIYVTTWHHELFFEPHPPNDSNRLA